MPIEIRVLGPNDLDLLMTAEVFDNPVDPDFAREFLNDPRHHIVVAVDAGQIVGFVSAVHYLHPDAAPQMFIDQAGVEESHQRRGLSKAMLLKMFDIGRDRKCTEAWVLTDRTNTAAMALYKSVGGLEGADETSPPDATVGYRFDLLR